MNYAVDIISVISLQRSLGGLKTYVRASFIDSFAFQEECYGNGIWFINFK